MSAQPATPPTSHDQTSPQPESSPRRTAQQLMMDEIHLGMKQRELERQAIDKTYKRKQYDELATSSLRKVHVTSCAIQHLVLTLI
jgi:hypothetical protein